jgi:hypothetical protein
VHPEIFLAITASAIFSHPFTKFGSNLEISVKAWLTPAESNGALLSPRIWTDWTWTDQIVVLRVANDINKKLALKIKVYMQSGSK